MINIRKRTLWVFTILFISLSLIVCSKREPAYSTDTDFRLVSEIESMDGEFNIIAFKFDTGAYGYTRVFWGVVPKEYSNLNLMNYIVPDGYRAIGWTEKNEVIVDRWEPYYGVDNHKDLENGDILYGVPLVVQE